MAMKPKGDRANVRDIDTAKSKGGRPGGLGYDPVAGEEYLPKSGSNNETDVLDLVGQRGYSEHRFYTKSSNSHDHSAERRVRVPKGIDTQIYAAVQDVVEYRNEQDFWRDAALHRLEYLQKRYSISEEGRRMLELERLRADSERRAHDIELMASTVEDVIAKLTKAWEARDFGILAEELRDADELIDWLREPYRTQVKEAVAEWNNKAREKIAEYQARLDN